MERIEAGATLPAITLPDQDGKIIDLAAFRGQRVLLSFHPMAWTGLCARQMEGLEASLSMFADRDTVAFGISIDTVPSKKAWAESLKIEKTRLLSDFWPHGSVAESLGIFRAEDGISERASILVDRTGTVRFVKVYPIGDLPDVRELMDALDNIED